MEFEERGIVRLAGIASWDWDAHGILHTSEMMAQSAQMQHTPLALNPPRNIL